MPCAVCKTAKPRRFCPALREEICTGCCATERERSIDCPFSCEFLLEAHRHERRPEIDPATIPDADFPLDDQFIAQNEFLLVLLGSSLLDAARQHAGAIDADAAEALAALSASQKAQTSGVIYESKPVNPIAADMFEAFRTRVAEVRARIQKADAAQDLPDNLVQGVIVFFRRIAHGMNNGRPKCRAFLGFLSQSHVEMSPEAGDVPAGADQPRVTL